MRFGKCEMALIGVTAMLFAAVVASGQDTRPASTATGAVPLKGRITAVRGLVEVKLTEGAPWQAAKEGLIVDEGGEFRTGPRSAVQFVIEPDQTITLDRLGTVKLLTAVKQASGKTKTDLGMKYGRTRYDISAGGLEHESTIRSPNSTLAVRGTMVSLTDTRPFPPEAVSLTGTAQFQAFKKQTMAFGGKGGKSRVDSSVGSAAETALMSSVLDPSISRARDPAEAALIADVISRGATVTLDRETGFRTVSGGTVPTDKQIVNLLPGNLNFVLKWTANTNLDLIISSQTGGLLYPSKELFFNSEGGKIPFDHQGGPNGGFEIASYPANFPRAFYGAGVNHVSGVTTPATFQVYLNGKLFPILNFDIQGQPVVSTTVSTEISHLTPEQAMKREGTLLGVVDLSQVPPGGVGGRRGK